MEESTACTKGRTLLSTWAHAKLPISREIYGGEKFYASEAVKGILDIWNREGITLRNCLIVCNPHRIGKSHPAS